MVKKKPVLKKLGSGKAPAILAFPETENPRSILIVLPGGGVAYDKRWALRWLPMDDLPILRVYIDLPLHGERIVDDLRERYQRDSLKEFYAPSILGMVDEIPSVIDDLLKLTQDFPVETIRICGWSIGGLAAFLSGIEEKRITALAGFAIPVDGDHIRLKRLPTDEEGLALLEKLDLLTKAKDLYPRPVLLMHGLKDDWVDVESSRLLHGTLKPVYAGFPERLRFVEYENLSHDPCSNGKGLVAIREEIRRWLLVDPGRR